MIELPITSFYASLLALMYIGLAFNTIRARKRNQVAIGDGGHVQLSHAIRAHGNFAEYVPLALLLLLLLELQAYPAPLLHGLANLLVAGRISHAYSVTVAELLPAPRRTLRFRMAGMIATFTMLGVSALALLLA